MKRKSSYRNKWIELVGIFGELCVYCRNEPAVCIDHVIPVSYIEYGGIENLRPSCSWCNLLASNLVFDDFDEKYNWLRRERDKKSKYKHRRTVCTDCWLPYQCPLHSPAMFQCAECFDLENKTKYSQGEGWKRWLSLLDDAGILVDAHRQFAAMSRELRGKNTIMRNRIRIFGEIYSSYSEFDDTQNTVNWLLQGVN